MLLALGGAWLAALPISACRREARSSTLAPDETSTIQPAPQTPASPTASGTATKRPSPQPLPTLTGPAGEALPPPVQQALVHAAIEHDADFDVVRLVSYTELEWPSPALGCPEEGRFYPQVVTPGFLVVVDVEGRSFEYHTDRGVTVVNCTANQG